MQNFQSVSVSGIISIFLYTYVHNTIRCLTMTFYLPEQQQQEIHSMMGLLEEEVFESQALDAQWAALVVSFSHPPPPFLHLLLSLSAALAFLSVS